MTLLFTNARLIDPEAGTVTPGSLLIENGLIAQILPPDAKSKGQTLNCHGLHLAPGIVDIGVKVGQRFQREFGAGL